MDRLTYTTPGGSRVSKGACARVECDWDCDACGIYKIISKLWEYEETGLAPEQVAAMKGRHTARQGLIDENEKLKEDLEGMKNSYQQLQEINDRTYRSNMAMGKDLEWAINYLREGGGCAGCKYEDEQETAEPCARCQRITLQGDDLWEFHGSTDINVGAKEE